jgi:hypothetical protein
MILAKGETAQTGFVYIVFVTLTNSALLEKNY